MCQEPAPFVSRSLPGGVLPAFCPAVSRIDKTIGQIEPCQIGPFVLTCTTVWTISIPSALHNILHSQKAMKPRRYFNFPTLAPSLEERLPIPYLTLESVSLWSPKPATARPTLLFPLPFVIELYQMFPRMSTSSWSISMTLTSTTTQSCNHYQTLALTCSSSRGRRPPMQALSVLQTSMPSLAQSP